MCLMWWRCFRQLTKARQTTFPLYGLLQGLCSKPNSAQPMLPWLSYFAFLWKLKYLVQCPLDFFLEPRHYAKRRFLPPLPITIFVATAKRSLSVSLHGVSKQAQCTSGHSHFFESHRSCNALGKCSRSWTLRPLKVNWSHHHWQIELTFAPVRLLSPAQRKHFLCMSIPSKTSFRAFAIENMYTSYKDITEFVSTSIPACIRLRPFQLASLAFTLS